MQSRQQIYVPGLMHRMCQIFKITLRAASTQGLGKTRSDICGIDAVFTARLCRWKHRLFTAAKQLIQRRARFHANAGTQGA